MIEKYSGVNLTSPIAIEVNGVYHYPRNSEKEIGKDKLKKKILEGIEGY